MIKIILISSNLFKMSCHGCYMFENLCREKCKELEDCRKELDEYRKELEYVYNKLQERNTEIKELQARHKAAYEELVDENNEYRIKLLDCMNKLK